MPAIVSGGLSRFLAGDIPFARTPSSVVAAEIYEPINPVTVDSTTAFTADSTTWPTADVTHLPASDTADAIVEVVAIVLEAAAALDDIDAAVGANVVFGTVVEAADAADSLDAEVIAAEVPVSGGGYYPQRKPFPVVGYGFGILPQLEGEAHGAVGVVGAAAGTLPGLVGEAAGSVGVAGRSAAQLTLIRAAAMGASGQAGAAVAVLKRLSVASAGAVGTRGSGSGVIMKFKGAASGRHDDDEAAVMAFLLAA